jgi:hypothetical protein
LVPTATQLAVFEHEMAMRLLAVAGLLVINHPAPPFVVPTMTEPTPVATHIEVLGQLMAKR